MKVNDKVWLHEGDSIYPGVIVSLAEEGATVARFDSVIWRNVFVPYDSIKPREQNFSDFMWKVRQNFMPVDIKYFLP